MSTLLLKASLALALPKINAALSELMQTIPAPARPAAEHTIKSGGKRLRPLLTMLCAKLCGKDDDEANLAKLACTIEMLHTATLMHDDIIDNASLRRGDPAAHTLFGTTETLLAGDALLATANACVATFNNPKLCEIFALATAKTTSGEILELAAMHNAHLRHSEYEAIIYGKTAYLIRAACEMGAVFAGASPEQCNALATYGEKIGMAFQMVDDALDFESAQKTGKPMGGDLREGKLTPPLQLYRDQLAAPERAAFEQSFVAGSFTEAQIASICAEIKALGFAQQTRDLAAHFLNEARQALMCFSDNKYRSLMFELTDYISQRSH